MFPAVTVEQHVDAMTSLRLTMAEQTSAKTGSNVEKAFNELVLRKHLCLIPLASTNPPNQPPTPTTNQPMPPCHYPPPHTHTTTSRPFQNTRVPERQVTMHCTTGIYSLRKGTLRKSISAQNRKMRAKKSKQSRCC